MSVILILILASLAVAGAFLAGFIWAVKAGQYEDTCTPAMRVLLDDDAADAVKFPTDRSNPKPHDCRDVQV